MPANLSGPVRDRTFLRLLQQLGLTTNLELCLDAGDAASYTSGQKWLDTSENGYDFFRGVDGSAASDDPTFNGSAGGLSASEYWGLDGGDLFKLDQANPTWVENIHKDNAAFTFAFWVYFASHAGPQEIVYTSHVATGLVGFQIYAINANLAVDVAKGVTSDAMSVQVVTDAVFSTSAWEFGAISGNEATGDWILQINGTQQSWSSVTYVSPSASAASNALTLCSRTAGTFPLEAGARFAQIAGFSTMLNAAQLNAIFQATRGRFGV